MSSMDSTNKSPNSVGQRKPVYLDISEERWNKQRRGRTVANQGAPVIPVDLSGSQNLTVNSLLSSQNASSGNSFPSADAKDSVLTYYDAVKAILNPDLNDPSGRPKVIVPTDPTNVTVTWVGNDLKIEFDWDYSNALNATISQFIVKLTSGSLNESTPFNTFVPDKTQTHQTLILTQAVNTKMFNYFNTVITAVCVETADPFNNISNTICAISVPSYVLNLNTPTFTLTNANNGYVVTITNTSEIAKGSFDAIDIWEIESNSSTAPAITYKADGTTPSNYSRVYFSNINPATVTSPNLNQRWVIVRFSSIGSVYTSFAAGVKANPVSIVNVDLVPPNELTTVSAAWNASNGIDITYTMPTLDPGVRFIINLTPTSNISALGSFYLYPTSSSGTQTLKITKSELFAQFGTYYTEFTGLIKSVDAADNRTSGVSFNVNSITNQLASVTPNPTLTAIIDGYIVSVSNTTANVDHVEVYEYFLDPTTMLDMMGTLMDYMDADYVSGGASGANTIVLNNWQDQIQMSVVNPEYCEGMAITGIGIPDNTYITSITIGPSTNYTVHLSNNLTQQASGSYHMPSLVATGNSPLSVYTGNYIKRWVVVVYYDIFGNNSLFGKANPAYVIPLNPTTSLFDTAVQITSTGALYLGSSKTSVPNVLIGTNSAEAGIFVWGPNDGTTTSDTPSTQIIGAANSPLTFITKNAQIADWLVTDTKIENTLSGTPTKYTGLSATGTYSFWAGSTVTGGNSSAKFTVTPLGAVTAREIYIVGTGDANSKLIDAGSNFYVKHDGSLYATSATITGNVTASSGLFTGNVSIGSSGSLYSGTVTPGSPPTLSGQGFILNQNGLRFNSSSTAGITTIDGTTGKLTTTSASIGQWDVTLSSISKVSAGGRGNIYLDSSNGYIYVSDASISSYTAGINSASSSSSVAFWAGSAKTSNLPDPSKQTVSGTYDNNFVVRMDGKLYANSAQITGTVIASGSLGKITLDGDNQDIAFEPGTGGSGGYNYIIPRNKNVFYTTVFDSSPFSGSINHPGNNSTAWDTVFSNPMLAIGQLTNSYGTTAAGIGLYTGGITASGYTSNSNIIQLPTKPWISLTTNGIQIGATSAVGIKLEPASGTGVYNPGITLYTSTTSGVNGTVPDTGTAAIKLTNISNNPLIQISSSSTVFAKFDSSGIKLDSGQSYITITNGNINLYATTSIYQKIDNSSIQIVGPSYTDYVDGAVWTPKIQMDGIFGLTLSSVPALGNIDGHNSNLNTTDKSSVLDSRDLTGSTSGKGFIRFIVSSPDDKSLKRGPAIYYSNTLGSGTPSATSGFVGDIWLEWA